MSPKLAAVIPAFAVALFRGCHFRFSGGASKLIPVGLPH